jgi:trimeric autotransporter adhesin
MEKTFLLKTLSFMLFVCISCNQEDDPVKKGTSGNIETIAGLPGGGYAGDGGKAVEAKLGWVTGVAVDASGNIFIADPSANTIRKVDASHGIIQTVAGTFLGFNVSDPTPYSGDGGAATDAHLNAPFTCTVDASGELLISDVANNVLRKVVQGVISTIAGSQQTGYYGDGGPAIDAALFVPSGIAVDGAGNIFFSDSQNNVVRMISTSTGIISTVAGLGPNDAGFSGDNGQARTARLDHPQGLAIDANGKLYIADSGNNRIRMISNGVITTVAGTGGEGYSGDGGGAVNGTFLSIKAIAVDAEGNLYIADAGNNAIRKVNLSGELSTIAGTGTRGYSGDGGPATSAQLSNPWGVAVDKDGNVYIADSDNFVIRVVYR